jgi:outer membrane receptor protein involved in Fe transport
MLKFIITLTVLLLSTIVSSQSNIKGLVVNQNNKPIELVEVLIVNKDSVIVKNEFTNTNGAFILLVEKADYTLQLRQLGNIVYKQKLNVTNNLDLGTIIIVENKQQLEEVAISTKKKLIERKIDRFVFNIENSIAASGGDAIDALKVTPSISVQNDVISIVGRSSLSVMVDNKLMQLSGDDLINFLKTIKADDIKNIEVITNPPAKYDAEGNSGIVNIKLKKAKPNSWSSTFRSSYRQATYPTGSLGNSFTYQKNKWTLATNLNYTKGSNYTIETQKIDYPTQQWSSEDGLRNYTKNISGKIAIDYKINDKLAIGLQYLGGNSNPDVSQNNLATLTASNTNNVNQNIQTNLFNKNNNLNHSLNFHTIYELDTIGRKLSLDADYFNYGRKSNQLFSTYDNNILTNTNTFTSANNTGKQSIQNYALNIDMEHPLKWANLNYGSKISLTKTNATIDYFDLSSGVSLYNPSRSNEFEYTEGNQALYFSASKKFLQDKLDTQFGLRFENTETEGYSFTLNQRNTVNYSKLFPTAYINYTPNDNNAFSLNYGKRINRPRYAMLNPFREYSNPYSYVEGNPFLQPSYTHNISFGHTFKNNFNSTINYSYEVNGYSIITIIDRNTINQVTTGLNYFKTKNVGLTESYTFAKFKGWESYNSGSIYFNKTVANNPIIQETIEGLGGFLSTSNSFVFNTGKTFLGNIDVFYLFPNTSLNTKNKSELSTDIGLRYLLLKKNLVLNFSASDIFRTSKQRWSQKINGINFYNTNYEDVRKFTFSVSYKFGNTKLKGKEVKESNSEEKGRATSS